MRAVFLIIKSYSPYLRIRRPCDWYKDEKDIHDPWFPFFLPSAEQNMRSEISCLASVTVLLFPLPVSSTPTPRIYTQSYRLFTVSGFSSSFRQSSYGCTEIHVLKLFYKSTNKFSSGYPECGRNQRNSSVLIARDHKLNNWGLIPVWCTDFFH
jgi:hypothetical protein